MSLRVKHLDSLVVNLQNILMDIKSNRMDIVRHCDSVKNEIDLEVEKLIQQANKRREEMISQVETYQSQSLSRHESIETKRQELDEWLNEAKEYLAQCTKSDPSTVNNLAVQERTSYLHQEVQKRLDSFLQLDQLGNNQIDFEKVHLQLDRVIGSIYFKPVSNDQVAETRSGATRVFKFDNYLSLVPKMTNPGKSEHSTFAALASGKYVLLENFEIGCKRMSILSEDLKSVEKCKRFYFRNFYVDENYMLYGKDKTDDALIGCKDNKIFYSYGSFGFCQKVFILDGQNLDILHSRVFEDQSNLVVCVTANSEYVFCLNARGQSIDVYDLNLDPYASISGLTFDSCHLSQYEMRVDDFGNLFFHHHKRGRKQILEVIRLNETVNKLNKSVPVLRLSCFEDRYFHGMTSWSQNVIAIPCKDRDLIELIDLNRASYFDQLDCVEQTGIVIRAIHLVDFEHVTDSIHGMRLFKQPDSNTIKAFCVNEQEGYLCIINELDAC